MHCSSNLDLLCRVILIGLLQRLRYNQLFIYLAFVKIWDAWNELSERYCGNPTRLLQSAPGELQDNHLHFNDLFWFLAGGNVYIQTVWNAECTNYPPHTNRADETQEGRIENILLTSCLLLQHSRHTHQQRKTIKKKTSRKEPVCHASNILFSFTCLRERHILVSFFQITKSCGMLNAKSFNLPDFNYCKHSLLPLPLSI